MNPVTVSLFDFGIFTTIPFAYHFSFGSAIMYLILCAGLFSLFEKAGQNGWAAFIPFYNMYIAFKIAGKQPSFPIWLMCFACTAIMGVIGKVIPLIPSLVSGIAGLIQLVILFDMWYSLSLHFGHSIGYALGLTFLNPVFILLLGYGQDRYRYC